MTIAPPETFLRTTLGRTGRTVHRLGLAASFGVGGRDVEAAFEEHGVNYLYWGSMRTRTFGDAVKALAARGHRERLFVVIQSYARVSCMVRWSLRRALRQLGVDHADLLLLGWWNKPVSGGILDAARACKQDGLVRHLGVSTHHRPLAAELMAADGPFDVVHFRYNAANRGAEREIFPKLPARERRAGTVAFTSTRWGELLRAPKGAPKGTTPLTAGDCYRYSISNDHTDVVLCGASDGPQLRAALEAVARGPLEGEERKRVEAFGDLVYRGGSMRNVLEKVEGVA